MTISNEELVAIVGAGVWVIVLNFVADYFKHRAYRAEAKVLLLEAAVKLVPHEILASSEEHLPGCLGCQIDRVLSTKKD